MPAIDQEINSVEVPWNMSAVGYTGLYPNTVFGPLTGFLDGYPSLPCRITRVTTSRNTNLSGKKLQSSFAMKLNEWYRRKPPPVRFAGKDKTLRKELYTDRMDWRRSRPVRDKPKREKGFIPPGWTLKALSNGTYRLVSVGRNPRSGLTRFDWVPDVVRTLRPINRKWSRHSKTVPIAAKVNDLDFFLQRGTTDGFGHGIVHKYNSVPSIFSDFNPDVFGQVLVFGSFHFLPWTTLGYTFDPLLGISNFRDDRTVDDQAALLSRWSDEIDGLSKLALKRHCQKMSSKKVDLATELSQGMLTVNLMADIAKRIAKSLIALKKLKIRQAFAVLFPTSKKELANDFLAWKYGIRPLIGDLQAAAEHLAEFVLRLAPVKSNGHAKAIFERTELIQLGNSNFPGSFVYEVRKASIRVKYGSSFKITSKITRQAASLGFTNPLNVIWELVPFSFVVDWFLPIGDFLNGLSDLHGLVLDESYKTVFIREEKIRTIVLYQSDSAVPTELPPFTMVDSDRGTNGFLVWEYLHSESRRETIFCQRKVIPLSDVPLPSLKNPISKGHVNSAIALFTQLASK